MNKRAIVPLLSIVLSFLLATIACAETNPTAEDFSRNFLHRLGVETDSGQAAAYLRERLPDYANMEWKAEDIANTRFVAEFQASFQILMMKVALDLGIQPPPTLNLYIFDGPPVPQNIVFPANSESTRSVNADDPEKNIGVETKSTAAPSAITQIPENQAVAQPPESSNYMPPPIPDVLAPPGIAEHEAMLANKNQGEQTPPPLHSLDPLGNPSDFQPGAMMQPILPTVARGDNRQVFIDEAIHNVLLKQKRARVIVSLREPAADKALTFDEIQALVFLKQELVINSMSPAELEIIYKYESIFAFAAWVTKEGLEALKGNPEVSQIMGDFMVEPTPPGAGN